MLYSLILFKYRYYIRLITDHPISKVTSPFRSKFDYRVNNLSSRYTLDTFLLKVHLE